MARVSIWKGRLRPSSTRINLDEVGTPPNKDENSFSIRCPLRRTQKTTNLQARAGCQKAARTPGLHAICGRHLACVMRRPVLAITHCCEVFCMPIPSWQELAFVQSVRFSWPIGHLLPCPSSISQYRRNLRASAEPLRRRSHPTATVPRLVFVRSGQDGAREIPGGHLGTRRWRRSTAYPRHTDLGT